MSYYKLSALIFFILATSVVAYNEMPTRPEEENGRLVSWPPALEDEVETDTYWRRNLLLNKLLKKLQGDLDSPEDHFIEQNWFQVPDLKVAEEKKWVTALSTNTGKSSKNPRPRPQPKWKSKKGKGTPTLCYFKLCSFRSPV